MGFILIETPDLIASSALSRAETNLYPGHPITSESWSSMDDLLNVFKTIFDPNGNPEDQHQVYMATKNKVAFHLYAILGQQSKMKNPESELHVKFLDRANSVYTAIGIELSNFKVANKL